MGSRTGVYGYSYVRNINTHIERKSQNIAENVNGVSLSKTEKGRGFGSISNINITHRKKAYNPPRTLSFEICSEILVFGGRGRVGGEGK